MADRAVMPLRGYPVIKYHDIVVDFLCPLLLPAS
jgi:hypothetical protein